MLPSYWTLTHWLETMSLLLCLCFYSVVPSQVYALVGSEKKGQVLGGMVAAGAGSVLV